MTTMLTIQKRASELQPGWTLIVPPKYGGGTYVIATVESLRNGTIKLTEDNDLARPWIVYHAAVLDVEATDF